ncbi:secreted protein [Candidatus Magnetoovum chiemensis]|nr:secreted protein [Candidatus Magnetoovum chiemensis]
MAVKRNSTKKLVGTILVLTLLLGLGTFVIAADKIVGVVKSVTDKGEGVMEYVITDEKTQADQTISCNTKTDCTVKPGADQAGAKVTAEQKAKGTVIRKAVAGC